MDGCMGQYLKRIGAQMRAGLPEEAAKGEDTESQVKQKARKHRQQCNLQLVNFARRPNYSHALILPLTFFLRFLSWPLAIPFSL